MDSNVQRIVQIGTVTAVDSANRKVRVLFPDTGLTSAWLNVLRNLPTVSISTVAAHSHSGSVNIGEAEGHTHGAAASISDAGDHSHTANVYGWMPRINDTVLVLYIPVYNGDGFVLGGI